MKIPEGITIYIHGQKYVGEVPDHVVEIYGLSLKTEPVATKPKRNKKSDGDKLTENSGE